MLKEAEAVVLPTQPLDCVMIRCRDKYPRPRLASGMTKNACSSPLDDVGLNGTAFAS